MDEGSPKRRSASPRLVLILCPERSGSTLLSVMLGASGLVLAPPELHLLRYPSFDAWRGDYPLAIRSLCSLLGSLGGESRAAAVEQMFAGWTPEAIYRWILARPGEFSLIVDKTPAYVRNTAILERAESLRPFYIWLIRHPLGVARSKIVRLRRQRKRENCRLLPKLKYPLYLARDAIRTWRGTELRRHVSYWVEANERIRAFLSGIDGARKHVVHFEHLVRDPRRVLGELCERLDIELEPGMLDPRSHAPVELTWGLGDENLLAHHGIEPSVADGWRAGLDDRVLDARTRHLMEALGVCTTT